MSKHKTPRVLIFDVETAPILGSVWGLFDQTIAINQIEKDWHLLSFSAKWLGDPDHKVIYFDQRNAKNVENDKKLLLKLWKLLDECDIVITQNGKKFDQKKVNARFIAHGFQPPSSYKHIDVLQIARRHFGFTSHKLEYMTSKLCTKHKKLTKRKYSGFELWKQCLAGNLDAWLEMEKYNKLDVLSLEELFNKVAPWDNSINFNLYHDSEEHTCNCGSIEFKLNGYAYTSTGRYHRYKCKQCGHETRGKDNLLTKEKRKSLRPGSR